MSWWSRVFASEPPAPPGTATIRSVTFNTSGLRVDERGPDRVVWADLSADYVILEIVRGPAATDGTGLDPDALRIHYRNQAAARGGGLVSLDLVPVCGLPAVRLVSKYEDGSGYVYEGSLVIPLRDARFTLTMRAREHGITGVRESMVFALLVKHGVLHLPAGPPTGKPQRIEGLFLDPYDPAYDDTALCALNDDERFDELLPDHPLSKVRRWLRAETGALAIDDAVRSPFAGFAPACPQSTRISGRIPAVLIGLLYLTAGKAEPAERYFVESVPLENAEPMGKDAQTATSLTFLGHAQELQGKFSDAEWAFRRAHRIWQATQGDASLNTVRAASHVARICLPLGRYAEAGELFEHALARLEACGNHVDLAVVLNGLGLVRQQAGQHREAVRFFERAVDRFEMAEKEQGEPIADRATVLNNLADAHDALGDRRAAARARGRANRLNTRS